MADDKPVKKGKAAGDRGTAGQVRVHVGLTRKAQDDLVAAGDVAVERFARVLGLSNVDKGRLRRFGVLSGEVPEPRASSLADADGVEFVERDSEQKAL